MSASPTVTRCVEPALSDACAELNLTLAQASAQHPDKRLALRRTLLTPGDKLSRDVARRCLELVLDASAMGSGDAHVIVHRLHALLERCA